MSRILNRSIEDNKNILVHLKNEIQGITVKILVAQLDSEIDAW